MGVCIMVSVNLDKLKEIISELEDYQKSLEEEGKNPTGIIIKDYYTTSALGKNRKEICHLLANETSLIGIALRLLYAASSQKPFHYHLDGYSGELEEETIGLFITKIKDENELQKIIKNKK